jgi:hypothetical protein
MEVIATTQQAKWATLPCMIKMVIREREREPVDTDPISNKNLTEDKIKKNRKKCNKHTLPPAGYLYKDKLEKNITIDPYDLGLTILQARRKGQMEAFYSPETYRERIQNIQDKMKTKRNGRPVIDSNMWGDELTTSEKWPKVNTQGHLRILFYNVNGISYKHNYFEMDMIMQLGGQAQADILLLTEINLNLHQAKVRQKVKDSIRAYDKYAKVQMAFPPDPPFTTSEFNMGGNMAIVQGGLSGRCGERGSDIYGRWSWVTIAGHNKKVTIIGGYKVGKNRGSTGGTSVAQQEVRAMLRRDHHLAHKPREAFDTDLANFCINQQNLGHNIILMMDANTPLQSAEATTFASAANLHSIAEIKFPTTALPRTHQAGSQCIDHCLVTKDIIDWTEKFGYFPFFAHSLFDHRGMVIDVQNQALFGKIREDATRKITRRLRASHPSDAEKYRTHLKRMLKSAGIFDKVNKLCDGFHLLPQEEREKRWKHLQKYNTTTTELMIAAENKLKARNTSVPYWSPTLKKKGQELRHYNERIKADADYGDLGATITPPAGISFDPNITTTEELLAKHTEIKNSWRTANKHGESLRKQYLLERVEEAHMKRDITMEAAMKQILNAETSKALHRRHGAAIKKPHPGSLKKVLVPFPNSTIPTSTTDNKCGIWQEIDNDAIINKLFVHLNRKKLLMSSGRDFAPGGFLNKLVGPDGCSETADSILQGTFEIEDLIDQTRPDIDALMALVRHMERPKDPDGNKVDDMTWTYGIREYRNSFSKKSEDTSCGPSGVHMSHWIVACDDDELSQLHANFIGAAFRVGLPYERWTTSYHAMIQKKDKAWANSMRIVQLLEGDYNAGLRYLVQRMGVLHAENNGIYSGSTYGGRKGKNTHQILGRIKFTNEYCRLARTPAALADVDAVNCFDCMTHSGIGFFQRRQGSPKDLVRTQCNTLMKTKHYIKTGLGISADCIVTTATSKPQGSGQGGGASVGNWQSHNDPMILAFQDLCKSCIMATPDQLKKLYQWMVSFVDDNKLLMNFGPLTPRAQIYESMKKGVKTWRDILRITGGDLELSKTWIGILSFKYDTYTGKHMGKNSVYKAGVPRLVDSNSYNDTITMDDDTTFRELTPDQGLRLLGVRMSLSGSFTDEYKYRLNQINVLAGKLKANAFDERDAWLIYQTRYRPMIRYCLPITTFTDKQCKKIQSPFINAFLNKLKMNRHTPRVVIWGPERYGGLNLMNIEVEQLSSHIFLLLTNIRKGNETGQSMILAMSVYQLTLGCAGPFWDNDPDYYPTHPATHLSLQYVWEKLRSIKATLHIPGMWTPQSQFVNDSSIIDDFVATAKSRKGSSAHIRPIQIALANSCRMFLRVTWLSDILAEDGKRIAPWAYFGDRRSAQTDTVFPYQPKPPPHAWKEWRNLLLASYLATARMDRAEQIFPLHNRNIEVRGLDTDTKTWPPSSRDLPLKEMLTYMPPIWRQAVGTIDLPDDDGAEIAAVLLTGNTVYHWSDGSVASGVGAHAYTIRTKCSGDDKAITGDAVTPGNSDTISSLRSEHYGVMAALIILLAIEWKYSITATGCILMHIDNMEVVNRTKYGVSDKMAAEKHVKTDFDVWLETHRITAMLETMVCVKWVKGHQDAFLVEHQGGVGPMPKLAHFNILMDRRAERRRLLSVATPSTIPMTTDEASLVIKGEYITTKIDDYIRTASAGLDLKNYIREKAGWTEDIFDLVDWNSFGAFMKRLSVSKRAKVVKLQHNWQNTGRQKGLFLRSAGDNDAATEAEQCPMGCGLYEAPLHYLICSHNPKKNEMARGISGIKQWMRRNDTAPVLISIMMRVIRNCLYHQSEGLSEWNFSLEKFRVNLGHLVDDQRKIGWYSVFKGRISLKWKAIQQQYSHSKRDTDTKAVYKTAEWWAAGLIQQLIYFSLNAWQIRNDHLHKEKEQLDKQVLRTNIQQEIGEWYDRAPSLDKSFGKYFAIPLLQRKTHSTPQLQSWLATVKEHWGYDERHKKDTTDRTEQDRRTDARQKNGRVVNSVGRSRNTLIDHYFDCGGGGRKGRKRGSNATTNPRNCSNKNQ